MPYEKRQIRKLRIWIRLNFGDSLGTQILIDLIDKIIRIINKISKRN